MGMVAFIHSGCDCNQNKGTPKSPFPGTIQPPQHREQPSNTREINISSSSSSF